MIIQLTEMALIAQIGETISKGFSGVGDPDYCPCKGCKEEREARKASAH